MNFPDTTIPSPVILPALPVQEPDHRDYVATIETTTEGDVIAQHVKATFHGATYEFKTVPGVSVQIAPCMSFVLFQSSAGLLVEIKKYTEIVYEATKRRVSFLLSNEQAGTMWEKLSYDKHFQRV